MYAKEEMRQKL